LLIHDFPERKSYGVIRELAREIASVRGLWAFVRKPNFSFERAQQILEERLYDYG
jgi:hypothetical protein